MGKRDKYNAATSRIMQAAQLVHCLQIHNCLIQQLPVDMARARVLRTSGVILLLFLIKNTLAVSPPWILSVDVKNYTCSETVCDYLLRVNGEFDAWSLTSEPAECVSPSDINVVGVDVELKVDRSALLYFCARGEDGGWYQQDIYLDDGDVISRKERWVLKFIRNDRVREPFKYLFNANLND